MVVTRLLELRHRRLHDCVIGGCMGGMMGGAGEAALEDADIDEDEIEE
ncbi:hypothetical protein [Haladaptatus sp. NG-SE-30]